MRVGGVWQGRVLAMCLSFEGEWVDGGKNGRSKEKTIRVERFIDGGYGRRFE